MSASVYRALATAAAPALRLWLDARTRAGKEDPARLGERRGLASRPRPEGPVVMVHAASLGEARSALGVIDAIARARADATILFTTGTLTSAALIGQLIADNRLARAIHQFVPLDVPAWIARFLDHWRPDAALWIESELWPNLITGLAERGVALALLNGRLSERSFKRWRTLAPLLGPPLDAFAICLAQSETDRERLDALGARAPRCLGNLKFDAAPLDDQPAKRAALAVAIGPRPVWVAASIHPGEAAAIARAQKEIARRPDRPLLIAVPRHAARGEDFLAASRACGLEVARRSADERPHAGTDVYLADTMGELGLFYRLADLVFVGGSLIDHGGQNPLEPARLGRATLFGPSMTNFADIAARLAEAGAARRVASDEALAPCLDELLADPRRIAAMSAAARVVVARETGVVERVMAALAPMLSRLPAG